MNYKIIAIGIVLAIGLFALPYLVKADEIYQDKTCTWTYSIWFCRNPDYSLDHYFWTYQSMHDFYTPAFDEAFIPQTTYEYSVADSTTLLSGI